MTELGTQLENPAPALREVDKLERHRGTLTAEITRLEKEYMAASLLDNITEAHVEKFLAGIAENMEEMDREALKDSLPTRSATNAGSTTASVSICGIKWRPQGDALSGVHCGASPASCGSGPPAGDANHKTSPRAPRSAIGNSRPGAVCYQSPTNKPVDTVCGHSSPASDRLPPTQLGHSRFAAQADAPRWNVRISVSASFTPRHVCRAAHAHNYLIQRDLPIPA